MALWILSVLYTLDNRAGAPGVANMRRLIEADEFDDPATSALLRLGMRVGANDLDVVELLKNRLGSRRIDLPYQVPSDVWDHVNVFMRDLFNTASACTDTAANPSGDCFAEPV